MRFVTVSVIGLARTAQVIARWLVAGSGAVTCSLLVFIDHRRPEM